MSTDVIQQFRAAISQAGLTPPDIVPDGAIHRFSTNGKTHDASGWYVLYADDSIPAGSFGDWRTGLKETWHADVGRQFTPEETAKYTQLVENMRRQRVADKEQRHTDAAQKALAVWNAATLADDSHPYLARKGVKSYGLRVSDDGHLIVPMRIDGELHSLQFVAPDGDKKFMPGGRVSGCSHSIGKPDGVLCICEGYATGASIHEATGVSLCS